MEADLSSPAVKLALQNRCRLFLFPTTWGAFNLRRLLGLPLNPLPPSITCAHTHTRANLKKNCFAPVGLNLSRRHQNVTFCVEANRFNGASIQVINAGEECCGWSVCLRLR